MIWQDKTWLKGILILLLVFVLGGATGAALMGSYQSRTQRSATPNDQLNNVAPPLRGASADTEYLESLKRELNLNSEQISATMAIINDMRGEYTAVCAEVRPRYDLLRGRARQRMRTLLSVEQQQRFDAIVPTEDCNCPAQTRCLPVMTLCVR
ncbi:MAG: hypothetical protein AB1489_17080 [Acidobacteriota bacterium]